MPVFGIVAEGKTDQRVIENVLIGMCGAEDVRDVQPQGASFGNWGHVLRFLKEEKYLDAFSAGIEWLVVHIDTDILNDACTFLKRTPSGKPVVEETVDLLLELVPNKGDRDRMLFAIGVDSIECWLLGLVYEEENASKMRRKNSSCLKSMDTKLYQLNRKGLGKLPVRYSEESKPFRKRKVIEECAALNHGLARFVEDLRANSLVAAP